MDKFINASSKQLYLQTASEGFIKLYKIKILIETPKYQIRSKLLKGPLSDLRQLLKTEYILREYCNNANK